MTKEELEKETAEYFKSICGDYNEEYERTGKRHYWVGFDIKNAYLAGAESREKRIEELEAQNEKMKKYGKLLQDICVVMGNDPYMVWRGLEQRVLILWDKSEEEEGLKMAKNILDRLLKIKPHEWTEIDEWEIKEND